MASPTSPTPDRRPKRRHYLDAIRVSAILLLIPYHAARYVQKGFGEDRIVDAAVWFVHTWHMPLFFAISGFLAATALRRSGAVRQVRSRLRRLGVPLVIGMLTVVPLANFFVIEAAAIWSRDQKVPVKRELAFDHVFNTTPQHLWFIDYLLVISLLALGAWVAITEFPKVGAAINRGFRVLMTSWWGVLGPGRDQRPDPDHQVRLGCGRDHVRLAGAGSDATRLFQLLLRSSAGCSAARTTFRRCSSGGPG